MSFSDYCSFRDTTAWQDKRQKDAYHGKEHDDGAIQSRIRCHACERAHDRALPTALIGVRMDAHLM